MIIIGLLLVVLALIFGADLVWQNHYGVTGVTTFGIDLGVGNVAAVFVLGAIVGAAIVLGIALMAAGAARKGKKAAGHHRQAQDNERLEAENDRLRSDLRDRPAVPERVVTQPGNPAAPADRPVTRPGPEGPGATRSDSIR